MGLFETIHERMADNQSAFRSANERIEASAEGMGLVGRPVPFICECSDPTCTEIVRLMLAEYEQIRSGPRRFFCAPGHQEPAVSAGAAVVVDNKEGWGGSYVVVEKVGEAGEIAEEHYGEQ